MYCSHCGNEINVKTDLCPICGKNVLVSESDLKKKVLVIQRKEHDMAEKYAILVMVDNGTEYVLNLGEHVQIPLEMGTHALYIKMNLKRVKYDFCFPEQSHFTVSFEKNGLSIDGQGKVEKNHRDCVQCKVPNPEVEQSLKSEKEKKHSSEKEKIDLELNKEQQRVEVICPHCGSNQVSRIALPQPMLFFVYFLLFGAVALIIREMKWLFAIISLGSLMISVLLAVVKKKKEKEDFWTVFCETCNKEFKIDIPDGSTIITNLKVKRASKSNSGTFPWE